MDIGKIAFLYIYIALCIVVFNSLFVIYNKYEEKNLYKKINYIRKYIQCEKDTRNRKRFVKKLNNAFYLRAFEETLIDKNTCLMCEHKDSLFPELVQIAKAYKKKKDVNKAYFAHVIGMIGEQEYTEDVQQLVSVLITFIEDSNIYVKENVFRAISVLGECKDILELLKAIDQKFETQNEKLISENLLGFKKNHQELADLLMNALESFSLTTQIGIVNYLRYLPTSVVQQQGYFQLLYKKLINTKENKELRLAIGRYFKKNKYAPVADILVEMALSKEEYMWEYAVVAINSLQRYPNEKTIEVLKKTITSSNWHIRLNAAESLIALKSSQINKWENMYDTYGMDMIAYRKEIKKIKER